MSELKIFRSTMMSLVAASLVYGCGDESDESARPPMASQAVLLSSDQNQGVQNVSPVLKPTVVSVLSLGPSGHITQKLADASVVNSSNVENSDTVVLDAESFDLMALEAANAALKANKQVIVDSSSKPPNRQNVGRLVEKLIGEGSFYLEADGAVIVRHGEDEGYSVTPIFDSQGKESNSSVVEENANSVQNVLVMNADQ